MRADDRVTVDERYARAVHSAHLELSADQRCDLDYAIAAGLVHDGLGARLYRLRVEWDVVRAEQRQADTVFAGQVELARKMQARADKAAPLAKNHQDPVRGAALAEAVRVTHEAAQAVLDNAQRARHTARVLVANRVKSLPQARNSVLGYAQKMADYRGHEISDGTLRVVCARALDLWLDPLCGRCDGRGYVLSVGVPALCSHCGGSGRRVRNTVEQRLGRRDSDHAFGVALMVELERKAERVSQIMARLLSQKDQLLSQKVKPLEPSAPGAAAQHLQDRLEALRSAQANED